jgi:dipeptide/tripeptide permease
MEIFMLNVFSLLTGTAVSANQSSNYPWLDYLVPIAVGILILAVIYIIWTYQKGLKGCPREIYLMFFTKVTEYSAYGGINLAFVLYLSSDLGLSDIQAGTFMGTYSVLLTAFAIIVGPVCDTIGIKKTLLVGAYTLLFSRLMMPFMPNLYLATIFGFFPMAVGIAITGPVISVSIKRFTTPEKAALGFGMFYTLMNIGWATGAYIFDLVRKTFGETAQIAIPLTGMTISTYQFIILIGFFINIPDLIAILLMRDGVEMTEDKGVTINPTKKLGDGGTFIAGIISTAKNTAIATFKQMKNVFTEKAFWMFIFMLFTTVFVRLTFEHFHYTFPKYGIRIFGEGVPIGSVYGVLNPVLVVFLVPLFAAFTRKISSYKMMLLGSFISAASVFLAVMPYSWFVPLVDSWFGELVFVRWLDIPEVSRSPLFFPLIFFIIIFTIGEALWSPRLMQFTAQIAPKGKEGSYISLAVLPWIFAKAFAGPLSGWLLENYSPMGLPAGVENYPKQYMVWVWIGSIAMLSPILLFILKKLFTTAENASVSKAV